MEFSAVLGEEQVINARAETVFEKRAFLAAARSTRCIVPIAGWYEWDRSAQPKQPYYHTRIDGHAIGLLAGIYTVTEQDGSAVKLTFALLTTAASALVEHYCPNATR